MDRARSTYLAETYVEGLQSAAVDALDLRVRAAVDAVRADGCEVDWVGSLAAPEEETYSFLVLCGRSDDVARVGAAAALRVDHVTVVLVAGRPWDGGRLGR